MEADKLSRLGKELLDMGYSVSEIAFALGVKVGAINGILQRPDLFLTLDRLQGACIMLNMDMYEVVKLCLPSYKEETNRRKNLKMTREFVADSRSEAKQLIK